MEKSSAKPFVAILTAHLKWREEIIECLEKRLGKAEVIGPWHAFVHTDYYAPEMGGNLNRCLVSFEHNIRMHEIAEIKSLTKEIEDRYRVEGKRQVNIDPGYIDFHKVVLASGKGGGHMIMLTSDVYVDFILWYNKGWQPLPWAYPDFRDKTYEAELKEIRKRLHTSMSGNSAHHTRV